MNAVILAAFALYFMDPVPDDESGDGPYIEAPADPEPEGEGP